MNKRRVGRTELAIAPLVFGGNVFGWTADKTTSFALLDRLAAAGLNTIDTADVYSRWAPGNRGGESESILGAWMASRQRRAETVVITKVGMDMGEAGKGLSAAHIERAAEASLQRLRTDHIDIYFAHTHDAAVAQEESLRAFERLIQAGKVGMIGASNHDPAQLRTALDLSASLGLPRYEILQPEYNLYARAGFEGEMRDLVLERQIGVIPYYSLARGFLTGKYRSQADLGKSPRGGGVADYLNPRGLGILQALDQVAARHAAQPGEVALAWLMTRPGITAPIASASSLEQVEGLIRSTALALTAQDLAALEQASR